MADSSIILSNLDFDRLKNTFKQYLRSQDRFKDYDFEGSNMSILIDLLAYNTYMNGFYLNMVGNEMFMDSAQLRDAVVSHAKELNYTPASFTSAVANVNIQIISDNPETRSISIPKGTSFTSRFNDRVFTFTTNQNIVCTNKVTANSVSATFLERNVAVYEGTYVTDTYTIVPGTTERYMITNRQVDISSINVTVIEDLGATTQTYQRATTLFGHTDTSKIYFLQGAENNTYEIVFGDGVVGRKPKDNSVVVIEYRISQGELPNGCDVFKPDSTIGNYTNITITTNKKAQAGSVNESMESIKFNAPRAFTTQERAVTTEDFENLLKINFPEINAVVAYGGEQLDPPQYGKVFVAVDLKETDTLPLSKVDEYYKFLKPRTMVSIEPVFTNPEYVYISVRSVVRYNLNTSALSTGDVKLLTTAAIQRYAAQYLNNFNRTMRYSKLVQAIDSAASGIVSNETEVFAVKYFKPDLNRTKNYELNFGIPLKTTVVTTGSFHPIAEDHIIESTPFKTLNGQRVYLEDDGNGRLEYIAVGESSQNHTALGVAGTVDYETGKIFLNNFKPETYEGTEIKIYAKPRVKDISSSKDIILNISAQDVTIDVLPIRE